MKTTEYRVWAQSYDRDLDDVFAVQGDIARMITRSLAVRLTAAEATQMKSSYTTNKKAEELFDAGLKLYRNFTPTDNAQARTKFEAAIREDPKFATAYALLSTAHRQDWIMGWIRDYEPSKQQAFQTANTAVQLAMNEPDQKSSLPQALLQRGFAHLYAGSFQDATKDAEESIKRSPSFADGYALAAHILCYQMRPLDALNKMNPTVTRDPKYPYNYYYYTGHAYYVLGYLTPKTDPRRTAHFSEAEKHLKNALSGKDKGPNFRPASSYLVATLSELGRQREAVEQTASQPRPEYLRDPKNLEEYINRILPYTDPVIRTHLIGLWQAADRGVRALPKKP